MEEATRLAALAALQPTPTSSGSSRWKVLHECERKHDLKYLQLVAPIGGSTTSEQETGILTHAAFCFLAEGILKGEERNFSDLLQVASEQLEEPSKLASFDPFCIQAAGELLQAYFAFWGSAGNLGFPKQVKIVEAEKAFEQELADGISYSCRTDLIVSCFDELVVVDHKTRGRARSTFGDLERELRCDPSIIGQSWCVQQQLKLASPPPVWLNDIIKTKMPGFERHLVRVEAKDIAAWKATMVERLGWEATRVRAEKPSLMNPYACVPGIGRPCEYLKFCHGSEAERQLHFESSKA